MCQLHACAFASKLHWQSCLLTSHPVIPRVVVRIVYERSDEGSGDVGSTANRSSRAIYVFFRSVGQSSKRSDVESLPSIYVRFTMLVKQNAKEQNKRFSELRKFQPLSMRNYHRNQVPV